MWYSDDGGLTYQLSDTVLEKMDEAQLVELADGSVMANMRNGHLTSCDCRAVAISSNGGKSFSNITYDPALISPVRFVHLQLDTLQGMSLYIRAKFRKVSL